MGSRRIWLTRPRADSEALAAALANHSIESFIAPMLEIAPLASLELGAKPDGIVLTSRHALSALSTAPEDWRALPVYCVGEATAQVARAKGFSQVSDGGGDGLMLAESLRQKKLQGQTLLYLSGEHTFHDLPALLASQQIHLRQLLAYRAVAVSELPADFIATMTQEKISGAVFFSARSAEIAISLLRAARLEIFGEKMQAYCLSLNVAAAAGGLAWEALHVAARPTSESMITLIAQP